jgi:hypothetical protein
MWRNINRLEWAEESGFLCIKTDWQGETSFYPPIGPENNLDQVIGTIEDYFCQENKPFILRGVELNMLGRLEDLRPDFVITPDRDNFDYVYHTQDLIELKGRSFHKKKNHLNAFLKNYSHYEYRTMDAQSALACIDFMVDWCKQRDCKKGDDLDCEKDAIIEAVKNFDALGFAGGIIYIDHQMKAFTFGEQINSDTAVVHVEKGDSEIRGIYPAINQNFAQTWKQLTYINREEDMGLEGLRRAKESYNPVKMIEKFVVTMGNRG